MIGEVNNCFYFYLDIDVCPLTSLNQLNKIGYTHEYAGTNTTGVFVGQTVSLRCEDDTTRFEFDKYDDDPNDYRLDFICQPTKTFNLPLHDWKQNIHFTYPKCSGWCPKAKPLPPNSTGLYLSDKDQNLR